MPDEILTFITAQHDKRANAARAARDAEFCRDGHWVAMGSPEVRYYLQNECSESIGDEDAAFNRPTVEHIALNDPAFVIGQTAAAQVQLGQHRRAFVYVPGPDGSRVLVPAGYCECQVEDGVAEGQWPCFDVLLLAAPFRRERGFLAEWALLTSADPEPGRDVVVETGWGQRWHRTDSDGYPGAANWEAVASKGFEPESWTKVAGNYGPVKVVARG